MAACSIGGSLFVLAGKRPDHLPPSLCLLVLLAAASASLGAAAAGTGAVMTFAAFLVFEVLLSRVFPEVARAQQLNHAVAGLRRHVLSSDIDNESQGDCHHIVSVCVERVTLSQAIPENVRATVLNLFRSSSLLDAVNYFHDYKTCSSLPADAPSAECPSTSTSLP
jgi:hypothetical protein